MANTITSNYVLKNAPKREVILYVTLTSDGTNETNTVIYDSSAAATALGIADPLTCTVRKLDVVSAVAATARVKFNFDATTPVLAFCIPPGDMELKRCYGEWFGGLKNYAGTGITGDLTLTTTGLASGDSMYMVLQIRAN